MVEAIRIGATTCEVNAYFNYVTLAGVDAWNDEPEHGIYVIADFTKPSINDKWNQACQLEDHGC